MYNTIYVWRFCDAPTEYKSLSPHGGDEDWVALVPPGMMTPSWMESGTRFGVCDIEEINMEDGSTLVIGAHA